MIDTGGSVNRLGRAESNLWRVMLRTYKLAGCHFVVRLKNLKALQRVSLVTVWGVFSF